MTDDIVARLRNINGHTTAEVFDWCEEAADEIERLRAEIARKDAALQFVCEELYAPESNCSCHIRPPCNDCVNHGSEREILKNSRAALAPAQEKTNDRP